MRPFRIEQNPLVCRPLPTICPAAAKAALVLSIARGKKSTTPQNVVSPPASRTTPGGCRLASPAHQCFQHRLTHAVTLVREQAAFVQVKTILAAEVESGPAV
jgi:hypothetical protein